MKLRYMYAAISALYSIALLSCGDSFKEKTELVRCEVSAYDLTFEVSPTEVQAVDITSETEWKVAVDQGGGDWLTVSPLEGTGNGTITVSAGKNSGPRRGATLTVAARNAELRTITIIQDGYNGFIYHYGDFEGLQKVGLVAGIDPITIVDNDECEDGKALRIYTRPGEEYSGTNGDRFKVQTTTQFGSGRYEWRIYVPKFGMNDRASIGAFVYFGDGHELDFEICSGTAAARSAHNAGPDDMLCLVSSQANPFFSEYTPIKADAWHTFVLDLKLENDKYLAEWLVGGKSLKRTQLDYGEEAYFRAISSVENLYGMGDHAATQENYALFDYLEYVPYDYSMKPIVEGQLPPEPEGPTTRWDFERDEIPADWTNVGGTIANGTLNLPNGTSFVYGPEVGAGKYTWEIDVPAIGVGEKWLAGGNIAATNAEERSFSMFVFPGTEDDRAACQVLPLPGQMLVRCYTESLGVYGVPVDPGKHTLTIDLRIKDGAYSASWIIDGDVVKTFDTWYTPEEFQFGFSFVTFANGGGWQGDRDTQDTYTASYDYFEYKKYEY
ncbi:MAG: BACON domain-containing protein [Bacteroides sp.]|nr:BACON domain-containing protein [Bacteroides sp.]